MPSGSISRANQVLSLQTAENYLKQKRVPFWLPKVALCLLPEASCFYAYGLLYWVGSESGRSIPVLV